VRVAAFAREAIRGSPTHPPSMFTDWGDDVDPGQPRSVPAKPRPVSERVRDEGPIPGMRGWFMQHVPDVTRCTGTRVSVFRGTSPLAFEQRPFARVLAIEEWSPPPVNRSRRYAQFRDQMWFTINSNKATYEARDTAASHARVAQIWQWIASLHLRAPIAPDIRASPDAVTEHCTFMSNIAVSYLAFADREIEACAATVDSTKWPIDVCGPKRTTPDAY
jgi:hypothetical protein